MRFYSRHRAKIKDVLNTVFEPEVSQEAAVPVENLIRDLLNLLLGDKEASDHELSYLSSEPFPFDICVVSHV